MKIIKEGNEQLKKFRVQADIDRKGQTIHLEKIYQAKDAVEAKNKMSRFVSNKYGFGTDEFLTTELKEDFQNIEDVDATTTQNIVMDAAREDSDTFKKNFDEVAGSAEKLKNARPFLGTKKAPKQEEIVPKVVTESIDNQHLVNISMIAPIDNDIDLDEFVRAIKGIGYDVFGVEVLGSWRNLEDYQHGIMESKECCQGEEEEPVELNEDRQEENSLWTRVYAELDTEAPDSCPAAYAKREVKGSKKERYDNVYPVNDNDLRVFAATEADLDLAKRVAEHYHLKYTLGKSNEASARRHPDQAVFITIEIPEEDI